MTVRCARAWLCAAGFAALLQAPALTASHQEIALGGDRQIECRIAQGAEHRYRVVVDAGEYVALVVEQQGVDVIAEVRAADQHLVAEVDDDIRRIGQERVEIASDRGEAFLVTVKAAPGASPPGAYAIRVDTRRAATAADRNVQESRTLRANAAQLAEEGRFEPAAARLERALTLVEAERGRDDVMTAAVAAELAIVYRQLPDDERSEALFERALTILDRSLGSRHVTTATVRSRLAELYQTMGRRAKAEPLLRESMASIEDGIGEETRPFVSCLITLANLRSDGDDLEEDEAINRRALAILDRMDDTENVLYATALSNLGEVARRRSDYQQADILYARALAVGERVFGPDSYFIAPTLQNLGIAARERKDYASAESYYARVLAIRQRIVGPNHPDVAQVLNNMANIARARGDVAASLATHLRALSIWEHAAGPYEDATLISVGNVARTYMMAGDIGHALEYQRRADAILEKQLALNLVVGSERQKLLVVRGAAARTDRTVSLHLLRAPENPDAASLAALVLLQRKGRVQDAMADTFAAARQRVVDPRDAELFAALRSTTADLARVALNTDAVRDGDRASDRERTIQDLEKRKEQLEAELSEHSARFRAQWQSVTLAAIQDILPDQAALLEFAIFHPFDPAAERNADSYGPPHYSAYVIRRHGPPRGFDLGPAAAIDRSIDAMRVALRNPGRTDVKERARDVDAAVMQPLRAALEDVTRLIVSPDGQLNLIPFEALVDERGRYAIDRYAMSYATSGRDLLRMRLPRAAGSEPVIVADPLFGEPEAAPARRGRAMRRTDSGQARRSITAGDDLSAVYFAPLAATGEEARVIKSLFPAASLVTGARASKATLQRLNAPRMLHIASHGFFLDDAPAARHNPLLRSGLALAGANLRRDAQADGILTALEASALNLWGTKLVTLSGCDTGVGEVRNGEGVYGLRRAFVLAGAETLVMSLWSVSDSIARETMVAFYRNLRAGHGRGDALRYAKLAMLRRPGREHPFYWAGFIQSGEWGGLDTVA